MSLITVKSRSPSIKGFSEDLVSFSVSRIYEKVAANSKLPVSQVKLSVLGADGKHKPVDSDSTLTEHFDAQSLLGEVVLYAKDLGRQIAWQTVFLLEYLGPILIHLVVYFVAAVLFGVAQSQTQKLALVLAVLHFVKREYETLFVHRFSNSTMPLFNLFKNSGHYWILSGVNLSVFVYSYSPTSLEAAGPLASFLFHVNTWPQLLNYALVALWVFAEVSNFITHVKLAGIRSTDKKAYAIPYGYGFDWVVCPNYFFESLSWLLYALLVGNWSAWLFLVISSTQMYMWALKKNRRYLSTFGDEYKKLKRAKFIPFLV
ncbi:hypothetical protein METBIDRAFT_29252 [Metschnikowia bicuspidata var. bicuspidata NRRL YB-4993]|uniref:3-oxo-5-alpha-steroid 4-dehydrogenase C-terminal domain-containing protein n=1 Tax=Metschnikowia bicuspidata var. bicuspidata NRRL YB-4993 TaxID=869754 RepID=A0A1A0HFM1_9ASCO|nr:hypothetical protein METBIDRAFT_29252 [Metschnikowia bicuspidata var. bicuspidata NRRL YB-4993]OBA22658.1 hypothetical protein METBIDRAFT_29252 [Metschnikowia bicuspidata var. bicuspidata NRRL YB-4993]